MIPRPTADLTTSLGIAAIVSTICGVAIYLTVRDPTWTGFAMLASAGGTLIGILQRAPIPSPQPTPVQTHGADVVATKEQQSP